MTMLQSGPVNPAAHVQMKDPPLTEHAPPFWHGFALQGSRYEYNGSTDAQFEGSQSHLSSR